MRNEYDPGNTDAATLAAFVALGARIDSLQWELQQQRERADDYMRTVSKLAAENERLQRQLVKPAVWDDMQRAMVQSGVHEVTRIDTFQWRAVACDHEFTDNSLNEAATRAARHWAATVGKMAAQEVRE